VAALASYDLVARNTATASTNRIHADDVARQYGFAGGLVPGVDVYAYLAHVPAAAWGTSWLESGTMQARFLTPVYDGAVVEVVPGASLENEFGTLVTLQVVDEGRQVCATAEARQPSTPAIVPTLAAWPDVPLPDERPPASPTSLAPATPLAIPLRTFRADRAGEYLDEINETLPLFVASGIAHPGWLLRMANDVLGLNVVLGPWIHVGSSVQHHSVVTDGESVCARGIVSAEWEHKGHRFVRLDVVILTGDERVVARVDHTAIYEPRRIVG
jgi:acyl dehydratase